MAFALTLGGVTFVLAVIWGSPLVEIMRRLRLGKQIRIEGPQTHMSKMGTPAMGGILIVVWVIAYYDCGQYCPTYPQPGGGGKHHYSL